MMRVLTSIAAGAASLALAAPAMAQSPYPYSYPQQPYAYPQQAYPQGYAYPQQGQNVIGQVINQLLGNRYASNDRLAVERCATAAVSQASARYRPTHYGAYGQQGYGYGQQGYGYHPAMAMRVTAVTEVRRQRNGLRVSGLLDSRGGYPPYGQAYGYQNQANGDLSFRCNVDYRGAVTNVRIRANRTAYRR